MKSIKLCVAATLLLIFQSSNTFVQVRDVEVLSNAQKYSEVLSSIDPLIGRCF